jgi:hypothetical protein
MANIVKLTRNEGDKWYDVVPHVAVTDAELAEAQLHTYLKANETRPGHSQVTKLTNLPVAFHALEMDDMRQWDVLNGWRS